LSLKTSQEPHNVDRHVGAMIRAKRKAKGMAQAELAGALRVSFQQVQKYERGANRISSSKLFEIAQKLDTPLSSFFQGLDSPKVEGDAVGDVIGFLDERGSHELISAFKQLNPRLRHKLVALATAMAETP
jgi:transcriptional regulator with XRE-family HTH domain